MTAMFSPRKKNPSQVAQVDTPWPSNRCSEGRSSINALAPVETITEWAVVSTSAPVV